MGDSRGNFATFLHGEVSGLLILPTPWDNACILHECIEVLVFERERERETGP